jgi:hypothetical protein
MRKGKNALKLLKPDYDYWLDPQHPRVLYQHPRLAPEQILGGIERVWKDFFSLPSIVKRARRFGLVAEPRKFLAYLVVCRGLLTRYKRYGLSADSAVHGTNRKLATLLGKLAMALMKRKPAPTFAS